MNISAARPETVKNRKEVKEKMDVKTHAGEGLEMIVAQLNHNNVQT